MNSGFWSKLQKPFTILAPMANVTDWAFRQIIIKTGRPDVFYTEFLSTDGILHDKSKFKSELYFEENERPIVVQFFGSKPENFYKCAQMAKEMGYDGVDINMGCPDRAVERQGGGAALIKNPELALEIIKATTEGAGGLPVSVKTRLGYSKLETETWIPKLLNSGIAALAVHLRTRKEMSKVPARWDEFLKISEISKNIKDKPLIIGNGDVKNMADLKEKAETYKLDGIMVGRGIFQNPWFFSDKKAVEPKVRLETMKEHIKNFEKLWGRGVGSHESYSGNSVGKNYDVIKRFYKIYVNGWNGAKDLRTELMTTKSTKEALEIIENLM